eukprot:Gb_33701 [translate_table: standard]
MNDDSERPAEENSRRDGLNDMEDIQTVIQSIQAEASAEEFFRLVEQQDVDPFSVGMQGLHAASPHQLPPGIFHQQDFDPYIDPDNMTYEELLALEESIGNVRVGLPDEVMELLPVSTYKRQTSDDCKEKGCEPHISFDCQEQGSEQQNPDAYENEEAEKCVVCQENFEDGEAILTLPCKHYFHTPCITKWFRDKKICAICNTEVTGASVSE